MKKLSEFEMFCQDMYAANVAERRGYKDVILSYEDYFKLNYIFLKEKYAIQIGEMVND